MPNYVSLWMMLSGILLITFSAASSEAGERDGFAPKATDAEAALSFPDIPYLEDAFIDTTPADLRDGLVVGELGMNGGDQDVIVQLAQEIADGLHGSVDSLLISQKGKLLFESYYLRGRINLPHYQASATKSYTNLAVGRAIQLGYLTMEDLNKPLIGFLENVDATKLVDGAETITLHAAMTMRSGIRISDETWDVIAEPSDQLKGQAQVQAYLEHSAPISPETQVFHYQGIDTQLVMQVLDAVTPEGAESFIKTELLNKLDVRPYAWRTDVSGLPTGHNGSSMTSRGMMKWGMLVMQGGEWNGEPLVPKTFLTQSINRIVRIPDDEIFGGGEHVAHGGYGYFWWQADLNAGDKTYVSTSAQGGGGQFIILVDELDLIVVATAHDREPKTLQMTAERILPAFME